MRSGSSKQVVVVVWTLDTETKTSEFFLLLFFSLSLCDSCSFGKRPGEERAKDVYIYKYVKIDLSFDWRNQLATESGPLREEANTDRFQLNENKSVFTRHACALTPERGRTPFTVCRCQWSGHAERRVQSWFRFFSRQWGSRVWGRGRWGVSNWLTLGVLRKWGDSECQCVAEDSEGAWWQKDQRSVANPRNVSTASQGFGVSSVWMTCVFFSRFFFLLFFFFSFRCFKSLNDFSVCVFGVSSMWMMFVCVFRGRWREGKSGCGGMYVGGGVWAWSNTFLHYPPPPSPRPSQWVYLTVVYFILLMKSRCYAGRSLHEFECQLLAYVVRVVVSRCCPLCTRGGGGGARVFTYHQSSSIIVWLRQNVFMCVTWLGLHACVQ